MNLSLNKSDTIGAISSTLCIVHCLMTPILFAVQSLTAVHNDMAPFWWKNLDFLFITVSLFAIYRSAKNSTNSIVRYGLWINWVVLFFLILNEKVLWLGLSEQITYTSAITLALLHIYNLNFCQCKTENCCNHNQLR